MIDDLPTNRILSAITDKHFSEFLPTRWRQKLTGIDMEQNYVTVTLCIDQCQDSRVLPTRWRQKSTGIDVEQNYVTVILCIQYNTMQ